MQDILLVTQEDLKPYQKVSLPEGWSVFLQKDDETKRRISYEYAVSKEHGVEGIGHVVFDKTDEPRFYKKEAEIVPVSDKHGAITMVETSGRIIDTTVEESIQGLKKFKRDLPLAVLVACQKGRF